MEAAFQRHFTTKQAAQIPTQQLTAVCCSARIQSRAQSFSGSLSAVGRRPTADKEPEKLWARDWHGFCTICTLVLIGRVKIGASRGFLLHVSCAQPKGRPLRGPFLEHPVKFSDPKSHNKNIKPEVYRAVFSHIFSICTKFPIHTKPVLSCLGCDAFYSLCIGKTKQLLHERKAEHFKTLYSGRSCFCSC